MYVCVYICYNLILFNSIKLFSFSNFGIKYNFREGSPNYDSISYPVVKSIFQSSFTINEDVKFFFFFVKPFQTSKAGLIDEFYV